MKFKNKEKVKSELVIKLNEEDIEKLKHVIIKSVSYDGIATTIILDDYSPCETTQLFEFIQKLIKRIREITGEDKK